MNYGELRDQALQLLGRYSLDGAVTPEYYNGQKDLLLRIPGLVRDGLLYLGTTVRRLRASETLSPRGRQGRGTVYLLPEDYFQLAGAPMAAEGDGLQPLETYEIRGGRVLWVLDPYQGDVVCEYFRYPALPQGSPPADTAPLDCPPEAQGALALYVASHLAMEDDPALFSALAALWEQRLRRLSEGPWAQAGRIWDDYAMASGG